MTIPMQKLKDHSTELRSESLSEWRDRMKYGKTYRFLDRFLSNNWTIYPDVSEWDAYFMRTRGCSAADSVIDDEFNYAAHNSPSTLVYWLRSKECFPGNSWSGEKKRDRYFEEKSE